MTVLRSGSQGAEVRALQSALKSAGYNVTVDGIFGPKTKYAVQVFQRQNGLEVDGIVGEKTWAKLNGTSDKEFAEAVRACLADVCDLPSFQKLLEMI